MTCSSTVYVNSNFLKQSKTEKKTTTTKQHKIQYLLYDEVFQCPDFLQLNFTLPELLC